MSKQTNNRVFRVSGMSCGHCKAAVESAIRGVANVDQVSVDLNAGQAVVVGSPTDQAIIAAVEEAGYEAKAITPG
jgi:copper chaperone